MYLTCAVDPEDDNKYEGDSFCDLRSRKALYYYIVPGENISTCERTKLKLFLGFLFVQTYFLPFRRNV